MAEEGQPSAPKTRPTSPPVDQSERPYVPTLAVTSPRNYGNIDAENESNLQILSSVEFPKPAGPRLGGSSARRGHTNLRKRAYSSGENSMLGMSSQVRFFYVESVLHPPQASSDLDCRRLNTFGCGITSIQTGCALRSLPVVQAAA